MGFQFSRPLAANLANPAKVTVTPESAAAHIDAQRANTVNDDDRIRCTDCSWLSMSGVCRAAGPKHKPVVANRGYQPVRIPPLPDEGAHETAIAADMAKSMLLATVAHEFRTPLNGVLAMAEVMALGDLAPVQRDRLDVIRRSGGLLLAVLYFCTAMLFQKFIHHPLPAMTRAALPLGPFLSIGFAALYCFGG